MSRLKIAVLFGGDAHPSFQNSRPGNLHPCGLGQLVGAVFVHAQCRGQHTAAHQRDTRQLKEALQYLAERQEEK